MWYPASPRNEYGNPDKCYVNVGRLSTPIAPGDSVRVDGAIEIRWKNVTDDALFKVAYIKFEVACWDTINNRHQTNYNLHVHQLPAKFMVPGANLSHMTGLDEAAAGVFVDRRPDKTDSPWSWLVQRSKWLTRWRQLRSKLASVFRAHRGP